MTLLALGNGAPDIFSAFAAISQTDDHKSSLAIGALFGEWNYQNLVPIDYSRDTQGIWGIGFNTYLFRCRNFCDNSGGRGCGLHWSF